MNDTHETNLPVEESGELEEAKAPAAMAEAIGEEVMAEENTVTEESTNETTVADNTTEDTAPGDGVQEDSLSANNVKLTKEEILSKLTGLVNSSLESSVRNDIELLKQTFYKIHRLEVDELKKAFIEGGGEEKDFHAPEDEIEVKIKDILNIYKGKRATQHEEEEQRKSANYALKLQLIDRMKELTESQDDFNKLYNEFKEIQQRWKEAKPVPQEHANELWKNYQVYSERFYDLIKINNQFRDYDFKKNMELKTALCETVEKLEHEADVISAFHQLQKLHQQWREIGPVSKELRENLWARFKAASAIINKRHQEHFEGLKAKEQENLEAKTAICEDIEKIDYSILKTFKDWEGKNTEIIAAQEKWKHIGFAPKKHNVKVFERFRAACDTYFSHKGEFYRHIKEDMEKNLDLKKALCEKVEALKNSTEWKETTEKLIALQKEWKTIGSVPRKHSDAVWRRFISACDYFFEQKNKNASSHKTSEQANLAAKKELIEKINGLDKSMGSDDALNLLKDYMAQWNAVGFVPFKEKDRIYKEYHDAIDKQFDHLKIDQSDRKMQTFRNNLNEMTSGEKGKGKLYGERDKLMRAYERMKSELQTYENNIGFLSISSKGGGGLIKEMERKIDTLKEEMALIIKKIDAIDENLE
ncbi:MAG: DUF349 domain-containing protein [Tannerellaceae bacterium]|jgi:uncharacterized protein YdhG (YjbR/CyaY superfamily)|nr:DUF349 domain-containing protein [Tannerellaceae bacterium]